MSIFVDIEVYDPSKDPWAQAKYLAHGVCDALWTDDLSAAFEFLREQITYEGYAPDKETVSQQKSLKVEISLEDAISIRDILCGCGKPYFADVVDRSINRTGKFLESISKAELQKHPDPFPANFERDTKGNYHGLKPTAQAEGFWKTKEKLLDDMHKINMEFVELRCTISELKHTISLMQTVIDSMKGK